MEATPDALKVITRRATPTKRGRTLVEDGDCHTNAGERTHPREFGTDVASEQFHPYEPGRGIWLFIVGIALPVAAYGLPRRRPYAAKLAVVTCGLWLTVLVLSMGRALLRGRHWGATNWTIVITETIVCILIVAIVLKHRSSFVADEVASA